MKAFRLKYENGETETLYAETTLQLIKKYDLATKKHLNTRIIELDGEQLAIALSNLQD